MNILLFIILSLAVWRISRMLTDETGPYRLIEKFRNRFINYSWSPLYCFKCTSVWIGFFLTFFFNLTLPIFVLTWFASSAAAIFLDLWFEKKG